MSITASIQWHAQPSGTVRVHPKGGSHETMAPYDWACGVVRVGPETVELVRVVDCETSERWRAIADALYAEGWRYAVLRRADGRVRTVEIEKYCERADR